jgi:hypothetical protein
MWGARGPFPSAAAMVVAVVMPVVLCNKATENFNKNTKFSCLYTMFACITIYCKTYIIILVLLVVAWTEPELYGDRSSNHFGPMGPGILGIAGKLLSL